MLMQADRAKDLCNSRGSVEDIQVRLVHLLHIHLIFFPFWDYIPYTEVHYIWGMKII